jgi:hypothetical protein
MDITQFPKEVVLTANALIYAEACKISETNPSQVDFENPKIIANVLSLCIRRIKQIDSSDDADLTQRKFYYDLFWYIAEINKMGKNG